SENKKTKVKNLDLFKGKIHILVNIYSNLLEKINPQYIKAFLFNSNTEIEVPIKNTYTTFFEIQLNLKSIPEFKSDGINKIKIIYKKDDLFTEKILIDRKSTRLNSSHVSISYAVFC